MNRGPLIWPQRGAGNRRAPAFCVVPVNFLNTTAALSTAYGVNAQVLALVGQIQTGAQKGTGLLHEIPDQFGILEQLTKSNHRVTGGGDAVGHVVEPTSLVSGRPQPVGLEIAVNLWTQAVTGNIPDLAPPAGPPSVDEDAINRATKLIAGTGTDDCRRRRRTG